MAPDILWAPWRYDYLASLDAPKPSGKPSCFLCDAAEPDLTDEQRRDMLVLLHDQRGVLMLNRYPYSAGHLLASPPRHVATLSDMSADERSGLMDLAELATRLLTQCFACQGHNVGMNLGHAAGAAVPGHAHLHVVPRWAGDVNFMQVAGNARIIPQALDATYTMLMDALNA